jgi:hypothetical protein
VAEVSIAGMVNCTGRLRGNGATRSSTSLIAATSCQEMFACRSNVLAGNVNAD